MFFFKKKLISLNEFLPEGFIDIHSHLLPGIDDGATDLDNSIALLQKMASYGIKHFITTPHILGDLYPNTPAIIKNKLALVQKELAKRNITAISIAAAAEYMMDEHFLKLLEDDQELLTLKDNLVLVEMSYFRPPNHLFDILFQLGLKGYKPVLAHPERYHSYHQNFRMYQKLKNAGCLFQLNLLSLTENYGKPVQNVAHQILKENMYDFVGTDTHHLRHLEALQQIATHKNKKILEPLLLKNKSFLKESLI
jgi:tyrosine-protein phosphatase YwqE